MNNHERVTEFIEIMSSSRQDDKPAFLKYFAMNPTGDPRVLPYIEAHLTDTSFCIMSAPTKYGEIRLLAAYALAAEYRQQKIKRPIILRDVVVPIDDNTYVSLRLENKIETPKNVERFPGRFIVLEELRRRGKLPTGDLDLNI